jgi:hypothetical protein
MERKDIERIIRPVMWDYNDDPYTLYEKIKNSSFIYKKENFFSRLFVRMLERLNWYDLLSLFGAEWLSDHLTDDVLHHLRSEELKERYVRIRSVLQGRAVSVSGWDPEYRTKLRNRLLSNRWYSTFEGSL